MSWRDDPVAEPESSPRQADAPGESARQATIAELLRLAMPEVLKSDAGRLLAANVCQYLFLLGSQLVTAADALRDPAQAGAVEQQLRLMIRDILDAIYILELKDQSSSLSEPGVPN
jgi:hypothetical protein